MPPLACLPTTKLQHGLALLTLWFLGRLGGRRHGRRRRVPDDAAARARVRRRARHRSWNGSAFCRTDQNRRRMGSHAPRQRRLERRRLARRRQRAGFRRYPAGIAPVRARPRQAFGDRERGTRFCSHSHGRGTLVQGKAPHLGGASRSVRPASGNQLAATHRRAWGGTWNPRHGFLGRRWCAGCDGPVFSLSEPCGCAYRRHRHSPCCAAHAGRGARPCCGRGGGLETAGGSPHRLAPRHLAWQRAQPEDPGTAAARCARGDADPYRRQARVVIAPMYRYDEIDQKLVDERVVQFRDQTKRFLAGKLSEDEFRALRLRNGLYIQRYAPMLRIAIPYGLLSTKQLRKLAQITGKYDRGYGHFSTRQNLQLNWPKLERVPEDRKS